MKIQSVFCVAILSLISFLGATTTFADETATESKLTAFLNAFTENAAAPADWFGLFTIDNVQNNRFFWNGNNTAQTSYKELIETFKENNIDVSSADKVKSALFEVARKKVSAITDSSQITTAEKDLLAISRFDDVAQLTGEPKKQFERSLKIFQDIKQNAKKDLTKGTAQKYDRYETVGGIVLRAKDDGSIFVVPTHLENLASVGGINKAKNVVHIANAQNAETAKEIYKTLVDTDNGLDKVGTEFNTTIVVNGELVNVVLPLADQLKDDLNSLESITPVMKQRKESNAQKAQEKKELQEAQKRREEKIQLQAKADAERKELEALFQSQIDRIQSALKTGYKTIFVNSYSPEFVTAVEPLVKLVRENKLTVKENVTGKHQFTIHFADGSNVVINETEIFKNKLVVLEQVADVIKSGKTPNSIDKVICEKVEKAIETVPANFVDYVEQLQKAGIKAEQIQNGDVRYYYLHGNEKFKVNIDEVPENFKTNLNKVAKYLMYPELDMKLVDKLLYVDKSLVDYIVNEGKHSSGAACLIHQMLFNDPNNQDVPLNSEKFATILKFLKENKNKLKNNLVENNIKDKVVRIQKSKYVVQVETIENNGNDYSIKLSAPVQDLERKGRLITNKSYNSHTFDGVRYDLNNDDMDSCEQAGRVNKYYGMSVNLNLK